jgi:membrane protein YqaA with SNARE-associated domain
MPDSPIMSESKEGGAEAGAGGAAAAKVPRWHWHRRMYDWMLSFSHTPYATWALAAFSFCEAIFFPIPPFVLQIPLTLERRERAWYYAAVTTAASVVGGVVGFSLGASFHGLATRLFSEEAIHQLDKYTGNLWLLIGAAIAVHPFKLFAIAAGFLGTDPAQVVC